MSFGNLESLIYKTYMDLHKTELASGKGSTEYQNHLYTLNQLLEQESVYLEEFKNNQKLINYLAALKNSPYYPETKTRLNR